MDKSIDKKRKRRVAVISIIANVWFVLTNIYGVIIVYQRGLLDLETWIAMILGAVCYILLYLCSISTGFSLLKLMKHGNK